MHLIEKRAFPGLSATQQALLQKPLRACWKASWPNPQLGRRFPRSSALCGGAEPGVRVSQCSPGAAGGRGGRRRSPGLPGCGQQRAPVAEQEGSPAGPRALSLAAPNPAPATASGLSSCSATILGICCSSRRQRRPRLRSALLAGGGRDCRGPDPAPGSAAAGRWSGGGSG